MSEQLFRVGLLGHGTVGRAFAELSIHEQAGPGEQRLTDKLHSIGERAHALVHDLSPGCNMPFGRNCPLT